MKALRARVIKFSVDGFSAIWMGTFDASDTPIASVGLCEKSGDLGDGFGRSAVAEFHVLPVLWASGPQRLPLGGRARRLALSIDTHASSKLSNRSPSLKRSVNKRGGVNRETREFERFREADELNHHG
jgi:hypothetical protein